METIDLRKQYDTLLDLMQHNEDEQAITSAHKYTIEELGQLANFSNWDDDAEEHLFKILLFVRKEKLNEQFIFNKENILAIRRIDENLKAIC